LQANRLAAKPQPRASDVFLKSAINVRACSVRGGLLRP
jgi:hypothetical protein